MYFTLFYDKKGFEEQLSNFMKVILTTLIKLNTNPAILVSVSRIRTMSTTYSSEGVEHDHSACQFRLDLTPNQTDTQGTNKVTWSTWNVWIQNT